jgi:CYTH domain-containing protein
MNTTEKMLTGKNIDQSRVNPEFLKRQEAERKFIAVQPELMEPFRDSAVAIEQAYLSHPNEEFSLRVRAKYGKKGPSFTATLKDGGSVENGHLTRLEVETPISEEAYMQYVSQADTPVLRKLRAEPSPGFTVDFIEGLSTPLIEVEKHPDGSDEFNELMTQGLVDVTSDKGYLNESLAHALHGETEYTPESIDDFATRVVGDMIALHTIGHNNVVVGVSGMSGSGKSSAVQEISRQLQEVLGEEFAPSVLSTDDYHRGKKWLEETYGAPWTNWDDPRVYNTAELAQDLQRLANGEDVIQKHFDFELEETVEDGVLAPSTFTVVEGIFAGSPHLEGVRQMHYEVPTRPATSIGRDVRRLVLAGRANSSIGSPEDRLRYQLEVALPTYQNQERPTYNRFAASSRAMAERAVLLTRFAEWRQNQ